MDDTNSKPHGNEDGSYTVKGFQDQDENGLVLVKGDDLNVWR